MPAEKAVTRTEIDILYAASNKLTQAATPAEQLEAVSDYAREQGASSCVLLYIDNDSAGQPEWLTVVAEWTAESGVAMGLDQTFYMPSFAFHQVWLSAPSQPTLVEDVLSSDQVDRSSRANYVRFRVRGIAMLPLNIKGRWVGLIMFSWSEPRAFDERDRRIYTALIQQAGPVIDSVRLFEQTQKRAEELEAAKHEMDLLYAASNRLTQSMTPDEWLAAVSDYARDHGANSGVLFYVEAEDERPNAPTAVVIAAEWRHDAASEAAIGKRFLISDHDGFIRRWLSTPNRPTLIEDVLTGENSDPTALEVYRHYQMRATAILPLNNQGRWVGLLMFAWASPVVFEARDRRIYTALLQQATPVIDAVRLFEATRERALRAELLLEVNDALSQATDEQSILAAVQPLVIRYQAEYTHLAYVVEMNAQREPARVQFVAARTRAGRPIALSARSDIACDARHYPFIEAVIGRPNDLLIVEDVATDPRYDIGDAQPVSHDGPVSAAIAIPLRTGDVWQGILTFMWMQPQTFLPKVRELFAEIRPAATSVVASRRAYLAEQKARRETESRARELETVAKVSAAATTRLNVDELLNTVCALTLTSFNLQQVNVYLLDENARLLALATEKQSAAQAVMPVPRQIALDDEQDWIARVARERRGMRLVSDGRPGASAMAVPLVQADRLIGVLCLVSSGANRFTEADIQVMGTLADLIAVAIENARLYEQAQSVAVLEERNRLARELHDTVSQALYGIGLGARTARALLDRDPKRVAEPLEYVLSLAEAGLTEMRALIFQLRPESIENEGLVTALTKQAASLQARHGIQVRTVLCEEPRLPLEIKQALYLVAREAMHNTVKHARASHVTVSLVCTDTECLLDIQDDGVGFDLSVPLPGHYGLQTMSERVAQVRGRFELTSEPGQGTTVHVVIPVT